MVDNSRKMDYIVRRSTKTDKNKNKKPKHQEDTK